MHLLTFAPVVHRTLGEDAFFFGNAPAEALPLAWMPDRPTRVDPEGCCIARCAHTWVLEVDQGARDEQYRVVALWQMQCAWVAGPCADGVLRCPQHALEWRATQASPDESQR